MAGSSAAPSAPSVFAFSETRCQFYFPPLRLERRVPLSVFPSGARFLWVAFGYVIELTFSCQFHRSITGSVQQVFTEDPSKAGAGVKHVALSRNSGGGQTEFERSQSYAFSRGSVGVREDMPKPRLDRCVRVG